VLCEWHLVDELETQIQQLELKLKRELRAHPDAKPLKTLPGAPWELKRIAAELS